MKSSRETELKFDCGPEFRLPALDGLITVSDREFRLTANYWDTHDRRLLTRGVTLRHRSASDSSEEGWTLKLPSATRDDAVTRDAMSRDDAVTRDELTESGPPGSPPARLLAVVRALTLDHCVAPIATIVTHRRVVGIGTEFGHTGVEIADDDVVSRCNDVVGPGFRQVELELVDQSATELFRTVSRMLRSAGLRPSHHSSKLARVAGSSAAAPAARGLHPDSTMAEVIGHLIARGSEQLIANDPGVRLGHELEAVHQARVATRRLRSELKLLEPALETDGATFLRTELRWFGGLLGDLRDAQVLGQRLDRELRGDDEQINGAGRELIERIADRCEFQRTQLLSAMSGDRYLRLLECLAASAENPPIRQGTKADVAAVSMLTGRARRTWKQVRRAERALGGVATDTELHQLRKAVKESRYAAQVVARLGVHAKPFIRQAGVVQNELGELHDDVVLMAWLERDSDRYRGSAGFVAGQLHERAAQRRLQLRDSWRANFERLDQRDLRHWMH